MGCQGFTGSCARTLQGAVAVGGEDAGVVDQDVHAAVLLQHLSPTKALRWVTTKATGASSITIRRTGVGATTSAARVSETALRQLRPDWKVVCSLDMLDSAFYSGGSSLSKSSRENMLKD